MSGQSEPGTPANVKTCAGCGLGIEPGQEAIVTVTKGTHVKSVYAHEDHRDMADAATKADSSWYGTSHEATSFHAGSSRGPERVTRRGNPLGKPGNAGTPGEAGTPGRAG